ncbi:MAG: hypothetical protein J2P17_11510 [Mycobacterium sp.]|nr:hypothetical protein [Mycobacterium sp.]
MTSTELERQLSEALRELVAEPVTRPGLFERVAARARRSRRRRFLTSAVAATITVLVGVAAWMLPHPTTPAVSSSASPVGCPATAPQSLAPAQPADAAVRLVPGAPSVATVCRYHGFNQTVPRGTLARRAIVRGNTLAALVAGLNTAPLDRGVPSTCVVDFGEAILIVFGYASGPPVTVSIDVGGCRFARNGQQLVWRVTEQTLQNLTALVGRDHE